MQPKRDFDVLARLDVGTFSDVFKVRDTIDNREYAVKRICVGQFLLLTKTSGAADAFHKLVREVVIMKKLPRHENIVTCHDAWFEGPLQQRFTEWLKLSECKKICTISRCLTHPSFESALGVCIRYTTN